MIKDIKVPKTSVDELTVSLVINEFRRDNPFVTNKFIEVQFVCISILCGVNMIHLVHVYSKFFHVLLFVRIS